MIDKCDGEIATWSDSGDNFVVKNVEKFASVRVAALQASTSSTLSMALLSNPHDFSISLI